MVCLPKVRRNLTLLNGTLTGGSTKGSVKNAEILKMLEKADLKGHGFQKEVSRGVLSTGTVTTLFYYKVVDCSRVMQVMIEVQKLLPG